MKKIDNEFSCVIVQSPMFIEADGNFNHIPKEIIESWGVVSAKTMIRSDGHRIHITYKPSDIEQAFSNAGVDPYLYGILSHDSWDAKAAVTGKEIRTIVNEEGVEVEVREPVVYEQALPAGEKKGIRYEEALALECAYQRDRADKAEARIAALEKKVARIEALLESK